MYTERERGRKKTLAVWISYLLVSSFLIINENQWSITCKELIYMNKKERHVHVIAHTLGRKKIIINKKWKQKEW
jgi:hypothetical protein